MNTYLQHCLSKYTLGNRGIVLTGVRDSKQTLVLTVTWPLSHNTDLLTYWNACSYG